MAEQYFDVGIVVAKRRLNGPWLGFVWLPSAALAAAPAAAPWTRLSFDGEEETFYAGAASLGLFGSETAHYRDNLASGRPSLWVSLRPVGSDEVELGTVTADPYEGEAMAEGVGEIVEAVPMPAEIEERVAAFVAEFHVERAFFKRRRDRADPQAMARRRPTSRDEGEPR